ncbi:autotransporter domain-containing protein [Methylobacillus arboreus]|uniref:autotransporter domain-containing protein n=1 Tax=Methylobacillus arboreus TaxID=755170 RepID=UPI001E479DEB|nr:autotransporter domain-containing protein [Methylobacillus arboreus]MCB5189917.1 autotransporter domain-containing protein [Methylobacillus arboreus]
MADPAVYTPYAMDMDPAAWVQDRGGSPALQNVEWQGRDALKLEINPPATPDSFNNWQGYSQRTGVPAGASFLRGDLWIDGDWQNGTATDYVNTGMWGSAMPESVVAEGTYVNSEAAFPIIHFNNQDGSGRLQVWGDSGWIDLAETGSLVKYDGWNTLDLRLLPEQNLVEYYFNGELIYSWNPPETAHGEPSQFWAMYLKARNNGETVFDTYWSRLLAGQVYADGEIIDNTDGDIVVDAGAHAQVASGATIAGSLLAEGKEGEQASTDFAGSAVINGSLIGNQASFTFSGDSADIVSIGGNVELENGASATGGSNGPSIQVGGNIRLDDATLGGSWNVADGYLNAVSGSAALLTESHFSGTVNGAANAVVKSDASGIVMTGGSVSNAGTGSAVLAVSGGTYEGFGVTVTALGNGHGAVANTGGQVSLHDSNVSTQGQAAHGLVADGSGSLVEASDTSINVAGNRAYGAHASNGGEIYLENETVKQSNTGAYGRGLNATGAGSSIVAIDTVVTVEGTGTNGSDAPVGAAASQGASVVLEGGEIRMTGANRTFGIRADMGGSAIADGVKVSTTGENSHAVQAWAATSGAFNGQETTVDINGGSISTEGHNSYGLFAQNNGSLIEASGVAITTSGSVGRGLYAYNGGYIDLSGGSISTLGDDAVGIQASGVQSLISVSGLVVETSGARAFGASAGWGDGPGGTVVFEAGSIATSGENAYGVSAVLDGLVQLQDSLVVTSGANVAAAFASAGGRLEISGSSLTSQQGPGIHLVNNASASLSDTIVNAGDASILSDLSEAGQVQDILVGAGASLTQNNGILLQVNRNEFGMDGIVNLTLANGSVSNGDIVDLDRLEDGRSGVTNFTVGAGAQWIGIVRGIHDVAAGDGATLINTDGGPINGNVSGGEGATIAFTNGADIGGGVVAGTGSSVRFDGTTTIAQTVASQGASFAFNGDTDIGSNVSADGHAQLQFNGATTNVAGGVAGSGNTELVFNSDTTSIGGEVNLNSQSALLFNGDASILGTVNANGSMLSFAGATTLSNGLSVQDSVVLFSRTSATNITGDVLLTQGAVTYGGTAAAPILVDGNAEVNDGAMLGGNFIFSGALSGNGTIGPGNSVGTQTYASVAGFSGTYVAEVNAAGQSDLVHITDTGVSNLGGISLQVTQENGSGGYLLNHRYTILSTDGTLGTPFVSSSWTGGGLVSLDTFYNSDSVEVSLSINQAAVDSVQTGLTRNQRAVLGGALLAAGSNRFIDAALQQQDSAAAFDQLSGEIHVSARNTIIEDSRFIRNAAIDRVRQSFGSVAAASNAGNVENERYTAWTQAIGNWGHDSGTNDAARLSRRVGGVLFGADAQVGERWRAGVLAGYTDSSQDVGGRRSSANVRSYHLGIYGGAEWDKLSLRLGAAHSWHDIDTRRNVVFPGLSANSRADYDGRTLQGFADLGYRVDAGRLSLEPFASLAHANLHTDGFHEKDGAALDGRSQSTNTTFTTLGTRAAYQLGIGDGVTTILRGSLGWRRAAGDTDERARLAFAEGGAFGIAGTPVRREALVLDAGLDVLASERLSLNFSYLGQFAREAEDHALRATLNWRF